MIATNFSLERRFVNNKQFNSLVMIFVSLTLVFCFAVATSNAAPPNWIRSEDGLPTSNPTFDPTIFEFWSDVYCVAEDGLYVQLYNEPCFGWGKLEIPLGATSFKPVGDYLYAMDTVSDLWLIAKGNSFTNDNWKKVTSNISIDPGAILVDAIFPRAVFNGYVYGDVRYFKTSSSTHTTFDIYRSPDIGKTTMNWTKVVSEGFGDSQNHQLGFMGVFKNKLIAITSETHNGVFGDTMQYLDGVEVWESISGEAASWTQVNVDGFGTDVQPDPTNNSGIWVSANCNVGAVTEYNGYLYVGTKSHFGAEIWRYDGTGKNGWKNVSPPTLGIYFSSGPGRVEKMVVFQNKLYVGEGYPTANLDSYDGTDWTIIENGPAPFHADNQAILGLAVLPSRSYPSGSTGDKLFALTDVSTGGYQIWNYPFAEMPPTCSTLKQATISIAPTTAKTELIPDAAVEFTATVNAGSAFDFSKVWVSCLFEVTRCFQSQKAMGFVGGNGKFGGTDKAIKGPDGLCTDNIDACFWNSEKLVCTQATNQWVDTTAPEVTISIPQDGASYVLNQIVNASYEATDTVGVKDVTTVPNVSPGSPIPTDTKGDHTFTVSATDYGLNTTTKSLVYHVLQPPKAEAGPDQVALVGIPVTFDASGSSDSDGNIIEYSWNFGDGMTDTGVIVSHTYSAPGLFTAKLTVKDNDGLTGSDNSSITVKSPVEGTQNLISEIHNSSLSKGVENGLKAKLIAAIDALNRGKTKTAINLLNAFINQVNAQRGKTITNAQADSWIAEALKLIDSIKA